MQYMTARQIADRWGITVRRVQDMCKQGAISGAVRHGREWLIPEFSDKPIDRRNPDAKKNHIISSHRQEGNYLLTAMSIYNRPGTADAVLASLEGRPIAYDMFDIQLCLYRGEIERAKSLLLKYSTEDATPAVRSTVAMNLAMCATYDGDAEMWKKSLQLLTEDKTYNEEHRNFVDFLVAANHSLIADTSRFPDWFKRGDFTPLPRQAMPLARYYYIKYLYISAHEDNGIGANGRSDAMGFLRLMPLMIEPLITESHHEGVMVNEASLRIMCAVAYHVSGEDGLAREHINKVLEIALPDRLYMLLSENRHRLGTLLDEMLEARDSRAFAEVKRMSKRVQAGWIRLHNQLRERNIVDNLSSREMQIAKLAVYGLQNKEIADRLGITVNAVKQILRSAMDKTGANSRQELHKYL